MSKIPSCGGTPGTPGRHALFVDGGKAALVQYTADLALTSYQKWQITLDKFVLTDVTDGEPTVYPASTLRYAGGAKLTSVSSVALSTSAIACDPGAQQDEIELTSSGPTALSYEDGQFIANWKTPKSPGTCYRATATTADGSSISALFRLR